MEAAAYTVIDGADGPTSIFLAGKDSRIYQRDDDDFRVWTGVTICYTLNSDRRVYCTYHMYAEEILDALNTIRNDQEYLEAAYGIEIGPVYQDAEVASLTVNYSFFEDDSYWSTDLTITDPDELEELQSLLVDDGLIYYNMFYQKENYISASVRLRKASDGWRYALFPAGDVPQWLQDRIEESKELEEY